NQTGWLDDGAGYDPATDTWRPIAAAGAPSGRANQTAVWTGTQMLVWGGVAMPMAGWLGDGGAYTPAPTCRFVLGFAALHAALPAAVGDCLDNERHAANGDGVQHTTRGLLVWRKASNTTAFTNGYSTWLVAPPPLAWAAAVRP